MKVYAISDLHLDHPDNRQGLAAMPAHPDDWLLLAGDLSHRPADLVWALDLLRARFARVVWTPGNHDLWTLSSDERTDLRGQARYEHLVALCTERGVLTPEDPYPAVTIDHQPYIIAPLFLLYDYSFRPDHVAAADAVRWARAGRVLCADELYLHPDPHPSRAAWCEARCAATEARLTELPRDHGLVLVNHFPLRQDLIRLWPWLRRFSLWCGTRHTEQWHRRFNVAAAVSGHLHVRSTRARDGVRFEEVSLGYPRQWSRRRGVASYLRQILPPPD